MPTFFAFFGHFYLERVHLVLEAFLHPLLLLGFPEVRHDNHDENYDNSTHRSDTAQMERSQTLVMLHLTILK